MGKSGAFRWSSRFTWGFFRKATVASHTSPRLKPHRLEAMPTAMPEEPLTSRLGNREGSTRGSFRLSSKFGSQSTVSFSISRSISSEILAMRASV